MWQPQGIYSEYVLRSPVILAGSESVSGLYNYPAARIAVICGSSFKDQKLFKSIFRKKEIGFFFRSWKGEPDFAGLCGTLKELEKFSPDTIIAVGGGSVIDGAKLCRLLYEIPYYAPDVTKLDGCLLSTNFIAVPTTVGTGAEVSSAAVYVANCRKEMVVLHELQPDVIIYDKRYVENAPMRLLCASAMDAMSHVVEGYISNVRNTIAEIQAEEALRLLKGELGKYLADDRIDYCRMQFAGYLGGSIQNHCIVGACHAVAHQLAQYGFSHSEGVALLLPAVIRMNAKNDAANARYQRLCRGAGFADVDDLIGFIENVCGKSGISDRKGELKKVLVSTVNDNEFINNVINDRGGRGNPVEITEEFIGELVRSI